MRAHRGRALLALALALTAWTVGCSESGGEPRARGQVPADATPAPASLPAPGVTLEDAEAALAGVLGADGVLGSATPQLLADRRNLLEQTHGAQRDLTGAEFDRASDDAPPHHAWGRPRLLVPRLQQGPFWFAAVVNRRDASGDTRTAVLTLSRQDDDRWYLDFTSLLEPGARLPEIAKDAQGYVTALDDDDRSVEISPKLMAPLHATSAEQGTQGFAAGLVENGRRTTGYAEEIAAERAKYKRDDCMGYDSIFAASGYPVHALRTADGGAMIMYSLVRTTTLTAKVQPCAMIRVPADLASLVSGSTEPVKELRTIETQSYVSTVPPRNAHQPARIIGYLGGVTKLFGT